MGSGGLVPLDQDLVDSLSGWEKAQAIQAHKDYLVRAKREDVRTEHRLYYLRNRKRILQRLRNWRSWKKKGGRVMKCRVKCNGDMPCGSEHCGYYCNRVIGHGGLHHAHTPKRCAAKWRA